MNITVWGAGNSGVPAAIYFLDKGHAVTLFTRSTEKKNAIAAGGIDSDGVIRGHFDLAATDSVRAAVQFADLLVINTQAGAHADVFKTIQPYVKPGQSIVVLNSNWGAYTGYGLLRPLIGKIALGETASQPFLGRYDGRNHVVIKAVKQTVTVAGVDEPSRAALLQQLGLVFATVIPGENVIATSLSSANPIIHVPIVAANLQRIENRDTFLFLDNMTEHEVAYIGHMDRERIAVGAAIGVHVRPILEEMNSFWDEKFPDLLSLFHGNEEYNHNTGPRSLSHRFITEDIPYGIGPVIELGRLFGVAVPYSEAVVTFLELAVGLDSGNVPLHFDKQTVAALL
jgi:opine dehydrogenase